MYISRYDITEAALFQTTPLAVFDGDFQAAIDQITKIFTLFGLRIVRSFDLQLARASHINYTCPYHGTDLCTCQLVVLLVYQNHQQPLTFIVHGQDEETELDYVITPDQQPDDELLQKVRTALIPINRLSND